MTTAAALLLAFSMAGASPVSPQAKVFLNARQALAEDAPNEALRLWLLRNGLLDQGQPVFHDGDFHSVVWAALGRLGLCQDGFPKDEEGGAGLWPLALHNWVLRAIARGPAGEGPSPFEAFRAGRQRRAVSLRDVLSVDELRSVTFTPTACWLPRTTMWLQFDQDPFLDLGDRFTAALFLRRLLDLSLKTLSRDKVESVATVEARLFDLELALIELRARRARREGSDATRKARSVGLRDTALQEVREAAARWPADSSQARFLARTFGWRADEWLALQKQRRLFLFSHARAFAPRPAILQQRVLEVIDALIARGEGSEVEGWIGFLDAEKDPARRSAIAQGERGKRLLALDPAAGFRERAPLALHRGVAFLEAGEPQEALRAFGYAMHHAEASRESAATLALARRWISYVLAKFRADPEVIATLQALVPRQEYGAIVEDLAWSAALRVDRPSFDLAVGTAQGGGSFSAKAGRLRFLAHGSATKLLAELKATAADEPHLTLRFVRELLERLEAEEAPIREANVPVLRGLIDLLQGLSAQSGASKSQSRLAGELLARIDSLLEGLLLLDASPEGRARALSPRREAFAGNVRLAPSDALPWPFAPPAAESPSAFLPLALQPTTWRDSAGERVFGWRISE